MFTMFWDMHSGGTTKLAHELIFIEQEEEEAVATFKKLFNRDPHHITCRCCGPDYQVCQCEGTPEEEVQPIAEMYPMSPAEYLTQENAKFILKEDIS